MPDLSSALHLAASEVTLAVGALVLLVLALLAVDFPGVEALRAQVPGTLVTGRCACGCPSVDLEPPTDAPLAAVVTTVPVEATAMGPYGEPEGLVMLFVHDGRLSYLE